MKNLKQYILAEYNEYVVYIKPGSLQNATAIDAYSTKYSGIFPIGDNLNAQFDTYKDFYIAEYEDDWEVFNKTNAQYAVQYLRYYFDECFNNDYPDYVIDMKSIEIGFIEKKKLNTL